jgi:methylase
MGQRVRLSQFYGIEINDFAVTVAETALWISRLKANGETSMLLSMGDDDFPLHEATHILHGNALRMDWNEVVPANQCSFILGNPPFYGARMQSKQQKAEIQDVFMTLECESISRMTLSVGVTRLQNKLTCT